MANKSMTLKTKLVLAPWLAIGILLTSLFTKASCFQTLEQRLLSRANLPEIRDDLNGIRVGIYFGQGMDEHSALAIGRAFQWMGCHVEIVNDDSIKSASLDKYDVLAFPGGETRPYPWQELGLEGKSKIREFIRRGGGYIGICLGALYACDFCDFWGVKWAKDELYLDLFPGVAYCGQEAIAPQGGWPLMTCLHMTDDAHSIIDPIQKRIKIVYYPSSPYFHLYKDANVKIVAVYEITGNPAMVAFEYGKGRIFLSGPHPEIEADSERDGSSRFNDLDDEGSEWPLLLAVMKWLTKQ
jgi:glutamine amidotransferase-like uncharacterized protein